MDDFEGTYAPQSPDLSNFHTHDQPDPFSNSYYPPQQHHSSYQPQTLFDQHSTNHDTYQYGQAPLHIPQNSYHQPIMPANGRIRTANQADDDDYVPEPSSAGKGGAVRRSKKPKLEEETFDREPPGVAEGIEVKTKFPVARIKRIMQADDEVGKVAQVTPTAVSKALELFMISVVTKAANEARARSSKRVTATHLKQAVEKDEQLDFLREIVSKVPDAPATKKEKEKEEDSEEAVGSGRKKRASTKRKKKDDDS